MNTVELFAIILSIVLFPIAVIDMVKDQRDFYKWLKEKDEVEE